MTEAMQNAVYYNQFRPETCRQIMLPGIATGCGVTVTDGGANTYGAWVDLALLAAVTLDTLIVGVAFDTPSAAGRFTVDIGSCVGYVNAAAVIAAGAGAIAAAHRAETRIEVATDAGGYVPVYFKVPIFIPAGVGILARGYSVAGGGLTINVSAICLQNYA